MAKIKVDKKECIGCGSCAEICGSNFEMKNGKAHVKKSNIKKVTCEKKAAEACPVNAISVSE